MRVLVNAFSDSWRCSITEDSRSWPSAKMSASTCTTSPIARLAGKRPSSTEGVTPSMTTRRRPSNCNSGTRARLLVACLASGVCQRVARGDCVVQGKEQPAGFPIAEPGLQRQHVLVARSVIGGLREQGSRIAAEVKRGAGAVEGDRGDRAVLADRPETIIFELLQEAVRVGPSPLLLEDDGLIESVARTAPGVRVLDLRRTVDAKEYGHDDHSGCGKDDLF